MQNLSIRTKLIIGSLILILLFIPQSIYFLWNTNRINQSFELITHYVVPQIDILQKIQIATIHVKNTVDNLDVKKTMASNQEGADYLYYTNVNDSQKNELLAYMEEINDLGKKYQQVVTNVSMLDIKKLRALEEAIIVTAIDLFSLKEKNKDEKDIQQKNNELQQDILQLNKLINAAVIKKNSYLEEKRQNIERTQAIFFLLTIISMVLTMIASIILSILFSNFISKPIVYLSQFAQDIDKNPEKRINLSNKDEIGILSKSINEMLDHIKKYNDEINSMSRKAGMTEVSVSILHNVGNVLNSVGVSTNSLNDMLNQSVFKNTDRTLVLLKENASHFQDYFTQDPKGKLLPEYLILLLSELVALRETMQKESRQISSHFEHINEIIQMQSAISGERSTLIEKIFVPEVLDAAINLSDDGLLLKNIQLNRKISDFSIITDKSRFIQIMVNFIQNAKDSLVAMSTDTLKIITVSADENKAENYAEITVNDNGLGISAENLTQLFKFGFTTKKTGHGFGLHNSFLSAKDMGGTIIVKSDGEGSGATFILRLPLEPLP